MHVCYMYLLVFSLSQLLFNKVAGRICQPLSQIRGTTPSMKHLGETFTMRCLSHPCTETAGDTYNFTKLNETTQQLEHIAQGSMLSKVIRDYSDAGIYCCAPQCANDTELYGCCMNVNVVSEIEFHMNGAAYTGQDYTASCSVTANPRMNLYMYVSSTESCDFNLEQSSHIDQYTTRAGIRINNITSVCSTITCSTNLFQEQRVLELLPSPKTTEITPWIIPTQTQETPTTAPTTTVILATTTSNEVPATPSISLPSSAATTINKLLILAISIVTLILF